MAAQDALQGELIASSVARAGEATARVRADVLQRRVAELEKARQSNKSQVQALLQEIELREQETTQQAKAQVSTGWWW